MTFNSAPAEESSSIDDRIRDMERRFRAIFEGGPVGIALLDREGRYLSVNPVRQRMLGYTEDELRGRHYLDVTHPEDIEMDQQINEEAKRLGRDQYQLEKRFVRSSGETVWSRITVATVRDETGAHEYSVSIAEDITAQKHIEADRERLLELEHAARVRIEQLAAEQAAILSQAAEGIIMSDPTGRITFVNEAALQIHGEPANPEGRTYAERYTLVGLNGVPVNPGNSPLLRAAVHDEPAVNLEWIIRRKDGREIVAQGTATPVVAEDGSRLGAVLTVRDITAQRRFEAEKDDFLSAAAHDLRTPLTTIKGHAQILQKRLQRPEGLDIENLRRGLDRIDSSATRMVSLVNDLLDVANIQLGHGALLNRQNVDLVSLAREIVAEQRAVTEGHRIQVHASTPEVIGYWEAGRLERVLANLLSNAIKYSPEGGDIDISVSTEDGDAVLCVQDQGVGIPAADLPYIFDRFRRGENVSGRISGTGIGLAAVRRIVEQHGGTVSAESEEGRGSVFTVRLPIESF
jgi:PAS domain S-box-containing protein